MAFNASVNLGTVGNGITGQTVSISGCTGSSCGSGCTSLATSQAVSSFPKTLSGIPDGTVSLFVKVDGGDCSGTSQCISITGLPGATPTPTSTGTATPTSTIGVTPTSTPTSTPTITPTSTSTGTPTITPTLTATPTSTVQLPGCNDTINGSYAPSGYTLQTYTLDLSDAADGSTITVQYTANNRPNRFNIYGGGNLIVSSTWAGSDTDYQGPWTGNPIDEDGSGYISFTYNSSLSYQLKVDVGGANPANILEDTWSVTLSCDTEVTCYHYDITGDDGTSNRGAFAFTYTNCAGSVVNSTISNTVTRRICARSNSVSTESSYVTISESMGICISDPTPTPSATVYVFYRAGEVMDSSISTTYCDNFPGGQGYVMSSPFYTADAILTPGVTRIYSNPGLTNVVAGSWSLSNVTRMAYITEFENQQAQNTPTTTNPNGDSLYDGGTYKFMRVDSSGLIISLGTDNCGSGGPGGPSEV